MPPRIGRHDEPVRVNHHPPHRNEADNRQQQIPKKAVENSTARKGDLQMQAQQRRERLERLIPAGTASVGMINDARLLRAANRADKAWVAAHQKAQQEFERVQPTIKARAEEIAKSNKRDSFNMDDYRKAVAEYRKNTGYTGATDAVEVSQHADARYREVLAGEGFKATDVRGDSVSKAADFMLKRADDAKPFSVLYDGEVKARVAENKPAGDYMVRIVKRTFMTDPNARLTNSEKAWMALPDEAAGAKLNARGIMNHVGYDGATVHSPDTKASDYVLMITKRDGQSNVEVPTWENRINEAKTHDRFDRFNGQPETEELYRDTQKYSELEIKHGQTESRYKGDITEFWAARSAEEKKGNKLNPEQFAKRKVAAGEMTVREAEVFQARNQMQNTFGMNENFGGEGYAVSPEGQVTGRELVMKNGRVAEQPQHIFLELREGDFPSADAVDRAVGEGRRSPLDVVGRTSTVEANPLRLGGEMKGGAIAGGAFSAATSLYEIFKQPGAVDYKSAATTVAVNTASGSTVGAISAGGERIVGRGIENALSRSSVAENGLAKLYQSGTARVFASRLATGETSNISSQMFNSTMRTVAGRVGGAGIVGGLVNGGFAAYDQIGAYKRGEVTGSQAIGTVTGEVAVGVGAGVSGALAGAALGSIVPGVGTVVGAIVGFGVGYLADKGLRGLGVDKAIAGAVTATIDKGAELVGQAQQFGKEAVNTLNNAADNVKNTVNNAVSDVGKSLSGGLKSVFGW